MSPRTILMAEDKKEEFSCWLLGLSFSLQENRPAEKEAPDQNEAMDKVNTTNGSLIEREGRYDKTLMARLIWRN